MPRNPSDPKALRFDGWTGSYTGFENPLNLTLNESTLIRSTISVPEVQTLKFMTTSPTMAEPAVGTDGTVYLSSIDYTDAYPTGKFVLSAYTPSLQPVWSTNTGLRETSIPSIADSENIYVGSANGDVVAVSPAGTILWRFRSGEPVRDQYYYALPHPVVVSADETIYSASLATAQVFVVRSGQLLQTMPPFIANGAAIPAIPVIGPDGALYVPTESGFSAQSADGQMKWSAPHPRPSAIDSRGKLFSVRSNEVIALDFSGSNLWTKPVPGASAVVLGEDRTLFVDTDLGVVAISSDGVALWTNSTRGNIASKADGGLLAVATTRPAVYTFSTLQNIAASGKDSWFEQWWENTWVLYPSVVTLSPAGDIYPVLGTSALSGSFIPPTFEAEIYHTKGDVGLSRSSWPSVWGTRNTGRAIEPPPAVQLIVEKQATNLLLRSTGLAGRAALEISSDLQTWQPLQDLDSGASVLIPVQQRNFYRIRVH